MRREKGFTLIELLVVIAIIALLVSILMPSLSKARELAKRAVCQTNQKGIGTAMALYTGESRDQWPYIDIGRRGNDWTAPVGKNFNREPFETASGIGGPLGADNRSVSALLFLLVRTGQPTSLFTCPSDTAEEMIRATDANGDYFWDFKSDPNDLGDNPGTSFKTISYAYQAPLYGPDLTSVMITTPQGSGVNVTSPTALVILADKSPMCAKYPSASETNINKKYKATTSWSEGLSDDKKRLGMSQNHSKGEMINFLKADGSVSSSTHADCGINADNIYSSAHSSVDPDTGKIMPRTRRGSDSTVMIGEFVGGDGGHMSKEDSFLVGPVSGEQMQKQMQDGEEEN